MENLPKSLVSCLTLAEFEHRNSDYIEDKYFFCGDRYLGSAGISFPMRSHIVISQTGIKLLTDLIRCLILRVIRASLSSHSVSTAKSRFKTCFKYFWEVLLLVVKTAMNECSFSLEA